MFEKFWNNSLSNYGLYPSHRLNTSGLGWDAMLKQTKIELDLILDPEIFFISDRYNRANSR